MKILHTADWHLGKKLYEQSRYQEQVEVLDEICEIADKEAVDVVLIAGDLFDNFNPSVESQELFFKTVKRLSANSKRWVVAIAGNHDSPDRIAAPDPLAIVSGILLFPYPNSIVKEVQLESGLSINKSIEGFVQLGFPNKQKLNLLLTPYANEHRLKKSFAKSDNKEIALREFLEEHWEEQMNSVQEGFSLLMAHLFVAKNESSVEEEPDDEKPILHVGGAQAIFSKNFPDNLGYVALGHLHRKHTVDDSRFPIVYSGSPLSYSFSESNQDKFVKILEVDSNELKSHKSVKLSSGKRLLQYDAKSVDDAVTWLHNNQESWVELTIQKDDYLTTEDKKRIHEAHDGVLSIVPNIKNTEFNESGVVSIDLSKGITTLFEEYFESKNKVKPNDEVLSVFKEVLAQLK